MTYDIVLSREELYQGRGDFAEEPPGTRKATVYIKVALRAAGSAIRATSRESPRIGPAELRI